MATSRRGSSLPSRADLTRVSNDEYESNILFNHPFDNQRTLRATYAVYAQAVEYMFDRIPERLHEAIMARLGRKLIKSIKFFKN